MNNFLQIIIDFIFPPRLEELKLRKLSPEDALGKLAPSKPPEYDFIESIWSYKDAVAKELVWQIKYKKNSHTLRYAAFALNQKIIERKISNAVLIPIPISKKRRRERGYNQCELIIDSILDINNSLKKDFVLLFRSKDIEKQTFKNRRERIEDTSKIFQINEKISQTYDRNIQIIIIDDVTTTGSTLKEARQVLLENGFINVNCLTIAH